MSWAAWLLAMVAPLVVRGVIGLGFSVITFAGVQLAVTALVSSAQSSWAAMPAAVLQLVALSGIPQSLGMLFGAMAAVVAMKITVASSKFVLKLPGS